MADDDVAEIHPESSSENTQKIPRCMVCFNNFHSKTRVPKTIPCGHSVCQECIVGLLKNGAPEMRGIRCPTCRNAYTFHDVRSPESSIPTNFVLREMLEQYETPDINQAGNSYPCCNCHKEIHEKDLVRCNTCHPIVRPDDSLDFMGRPKIFLICSNCIQVSHVGHSHESRSMVTGRWRHRALFQKFEKAAIAEDKRIQKLITTLMAATDTALKFKDNLQETIRQVENNADHTNINVVLRNFVRSAKDSAKFIDMSTEFVESVSKPTAPQFRLLGNDLFQMGVRQQELPNPTQYGQLLTGLFNENNVIAPAARPAPVENIAQHPVAVNRALNPQPPAPAPQIPQVVNVAARVHPGFQPVVNPPVQPINQEQLNAMLNYYLNIAVQQQAQYVQMINFNAQLGYDQFEEARRRAVDFAFQYEQAPQPQAPVPPQENANRIQNFFQLPFHIFNAHLPQLYQETLGGMIRLFVNNVSLNDGRQEVNDYFFTPPYENRRFNELCRRQIYMVLTNMMDILVPGQVPYTVFEQMRGDLNVVIADDPDIVWLGDDDVIVVENPNAPNVERANQLGAHPEPLPEEVAQNQQEDDRQDQDDLVIVEENNVANQRLRHRRNRINALAQIFREPVENDEDPNIQVVQHDEQEQHDDGIEQLQLQARDNFVFQLEDLLIEPPARATRSAKRRAEAASANLTEGLNNGRPAGPSSSASNHRCRSNTRQKRTRRENV